MKRQFFNTKFRMFISLTLIPICIFGFISIFSINMQVKEEAREKTTAITELMEQYMGELTGTLEFYRVTVNSDARLHLALIPALNNESPHESDLSGLYQAMQSLYYSQSTKPYIQSIFLTIKDSRYFINGINREAFENSVDSGWAREADGSDSQIFFKTRDVKKNKFDTRTIPVVTVYQKLKYNELMAINLRQDYFNRWLDSITDYEGQILLITDESGQLLFYNRNKAQLPASLSAEPGIISLPESGPSYESDGYLYGTGTFPGIYGLRYVSMIPQKEVFRLSSTVLKLTLTAGLLSILFSSILAYFYTMRDYKQIFQIVSLFEKAEKGEFEPQERPNVRNTAYFHIINNIINLFMSQTYLKVQLDAKKYALSTAQLSALQYQLNPHFLFNTLQSIDLEILKIARKPTPANQMISELSELLRYSLDEPMKPVTVLEEIEATKSYVSLQACRLGEQFQVLWEYDDQVLPLPMLRLLLQPIIENSLTHTGLTSREELKIKIKIRKKEDRLVFTLIDNGMGMSRQRLLGLRLSISDDQVESTGKHIGLKNIGQRLRLAYPNGSMKIWSKEGMGTVVELEFTAQLT